MSTRMKQWLIWSPRVLGLLFALFLSIFALDVFGAGYSVWETVLALLIHLIPTLALLLALALAWRWQWIGAFVFLGFVAWYVVETWGQADLIVLLMICGPPLVVGLLYLLDWFYRAELRSLPAT